MIDTVVMPGAQTQEAIQKWEPPIAPQCCNCVQARVNGVPSAPMAYCRQGHSTKPVPLIRLIHHVPRRRQGFRAASKCADFKVADE